VGSFSTSLDDQESKLIKNLQEINYIFRLDSLSSILDRLEKSVTQFGIETLQKFTKMSPMSQNLIFEF